MVIVPKSETWQLVNCSCVIKIFYKLQVGNCWAYLVFAYITYFTGFHNSELDYHICTGRRPDENIYRTLKIMKYNQNQNQTEEICFEKCKTADPVHYLTILILSMLVFFTVQTWVYGMKDKLHIIWASKVSAIPVKDSQSCPVK